MHVHAYLHLFLYCILGFSQNHSPDAPSKVSVLQHLDLKFQSCPSAPASQMEACKQIFKYTSNIPTKICVLKLEMDAYM